MHVAVKTASIAVGALAFITTFSACSSSQEAVSSSTTASAAAGIGRQAGVLGVRVCIVNEYTRTATVLFTTRDTARGEGAVAPGNQACGEGTKGLFSGYEVEGNITLPTPNIEMAMSFNANNGFLLAPTSSLIIGGQPCIVVGQEEGEKKVWDDGVLLYTVQRLADGQWKEFTITLADSKKPSASGLPANPAECPGIY